VFRSEGSGRLHKQGPPRGGTITPIIYRNSGLGIHGRAPNLPDLGWPERVDVGSAWSGNPIFPASPETSGREGKNRAWSTGRHRAGRGQRCIGVDGEPARSAIISCRLLALVSGEVVFKRIAARHDQPVMRWAAIGGHPLLGSIAPSWGCRASAAERSSRDKITGGAAESCVAGLRAPGHWVVRSRRACSRRANSRSCAP
jgi:hypothetical protein